MPTASYRVVQDSDVIGIITGHDHIFTAGVGQTSPVQSYYSSFHM